MSSSNRPPASNMANPNNFVFMLLFCSIVTFPYGCVSDCAIEPDSDGHVMIPNNWTSIGVSAFASCTNFSTINIPNNVTFIGDHAFVSCSSLSTITIPDSVTSIGYYAFNSCSSLSTITISNSVPVIRYYTFMHCTNLTTITIPDSVTQIASYAFLSCSSLSNIIIPNSVISIQSFAFKSCSKLSTISIPNNLTIGFSAFSSCGCDENLYVAGATLCACSTSTCGSTDISNSTSSPSSRPTSTPTSVCAIEPDVDGHVTIPNEWTSVRTNAFFRCTTLKTLTIPTTVTSIEGYAFYSCSSLSTITIPDNVTSIGGHAFQLCTSLSIITIPDSVTSIGGLSFSYCDSLSTITIPDSVTFIGDSAFYRAKSLSTIRLPDRILRIGAATFRRSSLITVTIPNSVTSIEAHSFSLCFSLSTITIPNSVTHIGSSAFQTCKSLTTIAIPNSVTSIAARTFQFCSNLATVTIPHSVTSIDETAFQFCLSLSIVTIPDSVVSIGHSAFSGCSNLSTITIPNSVSSISNSTFRSCSSLSTVTIPDSVTSVGDSAFSDCVKLSTITIPDSVTSIGDSAFQFCSNLNTITIPNNVTTIVGDLALPSCLGFGLSFEVEEDNNPRGMVQCISCESETIVIPNNVTSIGRYAFAYCSNVVAITIPDSVTTIGAAAFFECVNLKTINIPTTVATIGSNAFEKCGCLQEKYYAGVTLCECSTCATPTAFPTSSPAASPISINMDTSTARTTTTITTTTVIVISICVSLVVVSTLIVVVVMLRRRSQNKTTLQHIQRIRHQLLKQAKDTFYNYYGPTFKNEGSQTTFEQRYHDTAIQHTDCFSQLREIARGNGGIVHKAKYMDASVTTSDAQVVEVALKSCNVIDVASNHRLLVEARLMLLMKHPAIIPLMGVHLFKASRPWMVTLFMVNGDLKMYLRGIRQSQLNYSNTTTNRDTAFTNKSAIEVATKLAGALAYLNRIGVIHGDIAARNVLCGSPATNVVLSDFGNALPIRLATQGNLGDRYSAAGPAVPFRWMAPEALLESILSHETDVWSFGVLLWEIDSYGKTPYGMLGYDDVKQELLKGGRLSEPTTGFLGLYEMAVQCWCSRASERVTAHDLHQQLTVLLASLATEEETTKTLNASTVYLTVGAHDGDDYGDGLTNDTET